VTRTPSRNLAVYQDAKRGGNYKLTLVKKVWGDTHALRMHLVQDLALPRREVTINQVTGHISIRVRGFVNRCRLVAFSGPVLDKNVKTGDDSFAGLVAVASAPMPPFCSSPA
jgi:hypothetical protein